MLGRGATASAVSIEKVVQLSNPFINAFQSAQDKSFLFLLVHILLETKLLNELVQAPQSDRNKGKKYTYIIKKWDTVADTFQGRDYLHQLIADEVVLTARYERANLLFEFLYYFPDISNTFLIYGQDFLLTWVIEPLFPCCRQQQTAPGAGLCSAWGLTEGLSARP